MIKLQIATVLIVAIFTFFIVFPIWFLREVDRNTYVKDYKNIFVYYITQVIVYMCLIFTGPLAIIYLKGDKLQRLKWRLGFQLIFVPIIICYFSYWIVASPAQSYKINFSDSYFISHSLYPVYQNFKVIHIPLCIVFTIIFISNIIRRIMIRNNYLLKYKKYYSKDESKLRFEHKITSMILRDNDYLKIYDNKKEFSEDTYNKLNYSIVPKVVILLFFLAFILGFITYQLEYNVFNQPIYLYINSWNSYIDVVLNGYPIFLLYGDSFISANIEFLIILVVILFIFILIFLQFNISYLNRKGIGNRTIKTETFYTLFSKDIAMIEEEQKKFVKYGNITRKLFLFFIIIFSFFFFIKINYLNYSQINPEYKSTMTLEEYQKVSNKDEIEGMYVTLSYDEYIDLVGK